MKKILIALDDTKCAMRAVEYAGRQFGGMDDIQVLLVHVLPNLPSLFWDEGHILSDVEKAERKRVVDTWLDKHRQKIEPIMGFARDALAGKGVNLKKITTKYISDSLDVADSLLEEARDGGYQTVIIGRCGAAKGLHLLLGSVTNKLVQKATGLAICVVE
jgi:nucleotide-binding universal stress UspA family protein